MRTAESGYGLAMHVAEHHFGSTTVEPLITNPLNSPFHIKDGGFYYSVTLLPEYNPPPFYSLFLCGSTEMVPFFGAPLLV